MNRTADRNEKGFPVVMVVMAVILALVVAVTVGSVSVSGKEEAAATKLVTSVTVEYGDTLWEIAERYHSEQCGSMAEYVEEIKKCNQLWEDEIRAGESIVVPYWSQP